MKKFGLISIFIVLSVSGTVLAGESSTDQNNGCDELKNLEQFCCHFPEKNECNSQANIEKNNKCDGKEADTSIECLDLSTLQNGETFTDGNGNEYIFKDGQLFAQTTVSEATQATTSHNGMAVCDSGSEVEVANTQIVDADVVLGQLNQLCANEGDRVRRVRKVSQTVVTPGQGFASVVEIPVDFSKLGKDINPKLVRGEAVSETTTTASFVEPTQLIR